jgi:hypothetical protein
VEAALAAPTYPVNYTTASKWRWLIIPAAVFGLYYYGDVILHYSDAGAECIKFAEESKSDPAFRPDPNDKKIFVVKKWIRGGKVVVELGQKVADSKGFTSRLCVVGGGHIRLPGLFEQWQYR